MTDSSIKKAFFNLLRHQYTWKVRQSVRGIGTWKVRQAVSVRGIGTWKVGTARTILIYRTAAPILA